MVLTEVDLDASEESGEFELGFEDGSLISPAILYIYCLYHWLNFEVREDGVVL